MITLMLSAEVLELPYKGLNILGATLLGLLIWDPVNSLEAGFQLSFLATVAILLLYPLLDEALGYLLPKRPLHGLAQMKLWIKKPTLSSAYFDKQWLLFSLFTCWCCRFASTYSTAIPWSVSSVIYSIHFLPE